MGQRTLLVSGSNIEAAHPVDFLERLYRSVLVLASVSVTACLAHSGLVLMAMWNILSMASDISSVFLTVRVAITSLTFHR